MEDGGYYAIKGFDFQVDKTIKEIFDSKRADDEKIWIEHIQDLNTDDIVVQVKYKETQDFANSKIRDPLLQLLQLAISTGGKRQYILYCHFADKGKSRFSFDLAGIKEILKIEIKSNSSDSHKAKVKVIADLADADIAAFASQFYLEFADRYSPHFSDVITIIGLQPFCAIPGDAVYYYAIVANFLRKLVVENTDAQARSCDRKTILELIGVGKKALFYGSFEEFKGRAQFLKFIKDRAPNLYKNQSNYFVFGARLVGSPEQIAKTIEAIVRKYYKSATYDLCPPTFILENALCTDVKRLLISLDVILNDGFEELQFSENLFHRRPIMLRRVMGNGRQSDSLKEISFHVRVISRKNFEKLDEAGMQPSRVLYFGADELDALLPFSTFLVADISFDEVPNLVKI